MLITGIDHSHGNGKYNIEYKGRQIQEDRALKCRYGRSERLYRMADVSNGDFEETEFMRMKMTNNEDGIRQPQRSELKKKHDEIKEIRDRAMTNVSWSISRLLSSRLRLAA